MKRKLTLLAALLALTGLLSACTAGSSRPGEPSGSESSASQPAESEPSQPEEQPDSSAEREPEEPEPAESEPEVVKTNPDIGAAPAGSQPETQPEDLRVNPSTGEEDPDVEATGQQGYDLTLYLEENLPPESWAYIKETELGQFTIGVLEEETVRAAVAAYPGETGRLTIGYQSASCSVARVEELDRAIQEIDFPELTYAMVWHRLGGTAEGAEVGIFAYDEAAEAVAREEILRVVEEQQFPEEYLDLYLNRYTKIPEGQNPDT